MRTFFMVLAVLVAGCSRRVDPPPQQTTFVVSGAEVAEKPQIGVRGFEVQPDALRRGQPATVSVALTQPYPSRRVTLDWHGPDGWVVRSVGVDTTKTHVTLAAPAEIFEQAGRYRAVLRSGTKDLAEDSVTVSR